MKFGVVVFPGSNCDVDAIYALETILGKEVIPLWHKDTDLKGCDFIILPGGFSYGDYLRSGAIARFSPIMNEVIDFGNKGGFILGICNGFQILCEARLLPGTLLHNLNRKYICKNTLITATTNNSLLTSQLTKNTALKIPIAHAEGRFYADNTTLSSLVKNDQILFKYCNKMGEPDVSFNPNGSVLDIAGITNAKRNIFGMMPHPERAVDKDLGNTDGLGLFNSILSSIKQQVES